MLSSIYLRVHYVLMLLCIPLLFTQLLCYCALSSAFTLEGMLGIVWFIVWLLVAFNDPASHPRISSAEREYIESSMISKAEKKVSACIIGSS